MVTRPGGILPDHVCLRKLSRNTLPVVLYGCETWSLTLREERRLRVFENRVLRRTFGPKKDEVTVECKKKNYIMKSLMICTDHQIKMGTGSFPGVKCGPGVLLTTHPLLVPRSRKSRAIPLPTL